MIKSLLMLSFFTVLYFSPVLKAAEIVPASNSATVTDSLAKIEVEKAVSAFHALSKKEKKSRFREVKKLLKTYTAEKKSGGIDDMEISTLLLAIIAIIIPPLAIYLKERELSWKFWVSLGLLVTGIILLSSLAYLWVVAAALALLVVFDVL